MIIEKTKEAEGTENIVFEKVAIVIGRPIVCIY